MTLRPFRSPKFATNPTFVGTDAPIGQPVRIPPSGGRIGDGYVPGGAMPAQEFNAVVGTIGDHVELARDANVANWGPYVTTDGAGNGIDTSFLRSDGTIKISYSEDLKTWAVPGCNSNGKAYVGDANYFTQVNSGQARKYNCAHATVGHAILFWNDTATVSDAVPLDIFDPQTNAWTTGGAFSVANHAPAYRVSDAVTLSTGRIVAVGGTPAGATSFAWRSDDNGASWSISQMNVTVPTSFPAARVVVGPNDLLFAFTPGAATNAFYVSTDRGVTWSERTSLGGLTNFVDSAYLPGAGVWILTTTSGVYITSNPLTQPITPVASETGHAAMAVWGDLVVELRTVGPQTYAVATGDAFTSRTTLFRNLLLAARGIAANANGQFCTALNTGIRVSGRVL